MANKGACAEENLLCELSQCHYSDSKQEASADTLMLKSNSVLFVFLTGAVFLQDFGRMNAKKKTCNYIFKDFTVDSFFCLLFQPYAD